MIRTSRRGRIAKGPVEFATLGQFLFDKFNPVIDGDQLYVPNYTGGVDLYRVVQ